jgi:asparagine synthase (glutamine-hydrolysing)
MVSLTDAPLKRPELLPEISHTLKRRGPDNSGMWVCSHAALSVERLRIVDVDPRGDQPIVSPHHVLAFNGEVYNAPDLNRRYSRPRSSGNDAESVLPLLDKPHAGLGEIQGMFALAAWSRDRRVISLARDRVGEKPLFLMEIEDELWFASELGALLQHPSLNREMNQTSLTDFLMLGFFPEPATPFKNIMKLPAGYLLTAGPEHRPESRLYQISEPNPDRESLERALTRVVAQQTVADVPVGSFLSGGIDSGIITALANDSVREPIHTFTARFEDRRYDESPYAAQLAKDFGTQHHEVPITGQGLIESFEALTTGLSEPLADPALLPTWLLSREATKHVGVVLSGEGADELFGGYPTYVGHTLLNHPGMEYLRRPIQFAARVGAGSDSRVSPGWLLERFASHAQENGPSRHLAWTAWGFASSLGKTARADAAARLFGTTDGWDATRAMDIDFRFGLRDSLLVKLDRATMWHGLEARAPYLSPAITDVARQLSFNRKLSGLRTKIELRSVARRYLPQDVTRRVKRGLSVPIAGLINRELREATDRQFSGSGLDRVHDLLPSAPLAQLLREHRAGLRNHARPLWTAFTLLTWLDHWEQPN